MPTKRRNSESILASNRETMSEDDAPELTAEQLKHRKVTWRIGGEVVSPDEGRSLMRSALTGKTRVNMHLDNDVIEFFKRTAGGRGYQTLINSTLRAVMEGRTTGDDVKTVIQKTIRDEFARRAREDFARQATQEFTGVSTSDQIEVRRWNS